DSFTWVAKKKNYPNVIKPGKYKIDEGVNNNELINLLRSGKQTPVQLSFNNQDTLEKLAGRIASQIEADSTSLINTFKNSEFLAKNGFNNNTAIAMYLPNTYEFYWNTSAKAFQDRMLSEYERFWTENKKNKAKQQNLSPVEAITLASIVQKETSHVPERPKVAGLYLNRLNDNWPLQADPTVIFALKQVNGEDFEVKRVLNKDLSISSPYNTYLNTGLPPGPIGMPDVSSINAVLSPEKHSYYYMCASVEKIGTHEFASTLQQHNSNARKYQNWLNSQGVNR
ncbi:MAG TPA: endolytic transglycosylase MltG, partial [Flavobacteriaceae bacterium]|nr:endolytic transglycosylase MltG [Flavobacteriaceae bacterium]